MKKLTFITIMLGSTLTNAQVTEYIDITNKNVFGKSEMIVYSDNPVDPYLERHHIHALSKRWHYVEYNGIGKVVLVLNDKENSKREICTKQDDEELECIVVDSFGTVLALKVTAELYTVYISKRIK